MMQALKILILACVALLVFSCSGDQENKKGSDPVLEKIAGKDYAKLIEIPTTPDGKIDSTQTAIIQFESMVYDFDTLFEGDKSEHTFSFTNTGKKDLYILQTNSSCGCTVPGYDKKPVPPGEKGEIRVVFDSEGKKGKQFRRVSIITNAYPAEHKIMMRGFVKEKPN